MYCTNNCAQCNCTSGVIDTARVVCGAWSIKRLRVCLSHRSTTAISAGGRAGLLLIVRRQEISIDNCGRAAGVVQHAPTISSKCGQHHVDSRRRRLNIELFITPVRQHRALSAYIFVPYIIHDGS